MSVDKPLAAASERACQGTEFGCQRDFLQNRFVYVIFSPRGRGLSVGINLNPDKFCNFDCAYCEVDRRTAGRAPELDVDAMGRELESTVRLVSSGTLLPPQYARLSPELRRLSHVALSGDGEPTLCPRFLEAVQAVAHLRARRQVPFFKVVLITNASRLEEEQVLSGLQLFTRHDEVWAKLDGGTQDYVNLVNAPDVSIDIILSGILSVARVRPVVIQSLFPLLDRKQPSTEEISAYASRLNWLKERGAKIRLVQVYSATRPPAKPGCGHLSLKSLSAIAQTVRQLTNLNVEVF